jgi:WD40 repeat protein
LWDVGTGKSLAVLEGARSSIEDVAFSADGTLVAAAENVICIWDARSGALLHKLLYPGFRLKFSPDGKWLVSGTMRGGLLVWDTTTWKLVVEKKPHEDRLGSISFDPAGQVAVTGGWDGAVTFWSLPAWTPLRTIKDTSPVSTTAFSADGTLLLTGDWSVTLHVRRASDGAIIHTIVLPAGSRWMSAFFSPDGRTIITGTFDGVIRVWHATSGALLYAIDAVPDGKLFDSAVSPDGLTVAATGIREVDLWRLDRVGGHRILRGSNHTPNAVQLAFLSRDGTRIAAGITATTGPNGEGPWQSSLHILSASDGKDLQSWKEDNSYKLAVSPDLSHLVAGGNAKMPTRLWDGNGRLVARLDHGKERVRGIAISADGALVAAGTDTPLIRLWRTRDGASAQPPIPVEEGVSALAFHPQDPTELAIGDTGGRILIVDLASKKRRLSIPGHTTQIEGIEYSADGAWLVTAGRQDHTAKVWNARTGVLRSTLTGHRDNLVRASFSPDASLVATASVDTTARIWDAQTGALLRMIQGPSYTARFSPDGRSLLTTGIRDYVIVWDVSLDSRGPDEIARVVAEASPWQIRNGRLVLLDRARPPAP